MKHRTLTILTLLALLLVSVAPFAAQDATVCEDGFRLFDNERLAHDPVCIPENPERIVTLNSRDFDLLLATGSEPVGAVGYLESIYERNFPYMVEGTEITYVGFPANLEAVLGLEPDLIIASPFGDLEIYEELSAIAPTVIPEALPNVEWETSMRFMGDVLSLSDEVESLLADYDARVETLVALVGDPSEIEISVVRYYDDSSQVGLQMQLANAFSTDMLADIGFARPASQDYTAEEAEEIYGNPIAATLSLEELPLIDGEYLFAWSQAANVEGDNANEQAYDLLSNDPLWGTLEAVQNDQAFQVGGHWVGWGFPAAHEVLDDLFVHVAGVDPAEVSPNPFLADEVSQVNANETLTAADVGLEDPAPNSVELVEVTDECRVIRHALGETCVPLDPGRIVSLDVGTITDNLIALDRKPIGSSTYDESIADPTLAFPPALVPFAQGIATVGTFPPNVEATLVLTPDLIIAPSWIDEEVGYDQFASIAPTVLIEDRNDWRTALQDIAIITGDEDLAEELINQFYIDAADLDEQLPDMEIALLRPRPDLMQVYGTDAEATRILGAFGLDLTAVPQGATNLWGPTGEEAGQISYEVLDLIEGEVFFVISYNLEPDEMGELQAGEVWNALPVVQAGNAFNVEGTAWTNHGYFGVYEVMNEVREALLGEELSDS